MIAQALSSIRSGRDLTRAEADAAMEVILAGRATDAQIGELLTGLRDKGETVEELVGFATAMRRHAAPVFSAPQANGVPRLVDTCGTGGAPRVTFNISTCAAFVVAGAGARVAKHGNRSVSSRCGSADVLEALGVRLDAPPERMGVAVDRIGIGFFFAPAVHTAMKHAMAARRRLKFRTVFNLLGPLTNPARARAQVVGVSEARFTEPLALALGALGVEHAFVVHSADGMDEISVAGATRISELSAGGVRTRTVTPEEFGLGHSPVEALAGGDAAANAAILRDVLAGERSPRRDVVLANASAALVAAGMAADFLEGARQAAEAIDSGRASEKLRMLVNFSQEPGNALSRQSVP
jgi:anthranilate phosphoribosyltransferase